jgi:ketosteroid isomerase-like protein
MTKEELLQKAYAAFNRRDIDAVLDLMTEDVDWPNAMEGTMVHGKDAVRAYWERQWAVADPHVRPVAIAERPDGVTVVRVDQTVRTLDGTLVSQGVLDHEYRIRDGRIVRMDVRDDAPGNRFSPADATP